MATLPAGWTLKMGAQSRAGTPQVNVAPMLTETLRRYGLGGLATWVSKRIVDGASPEEIALEIYDRPEFKRRFPAIFEREAAGEPPLSVDEYLAYEQFAFAAGKAFDVDLSKDEIDKLLAAGVSTTELQERMGMAAQAIYRTSPEVRSELSRLYGVRTGDMIRFFMDPKTEQPKLQRKFAAAQIAGEAQRVGFERALTRAQAEGLYEAGVDADSARGGFGQLVEARELFEQASRTEADIGVDDQLSLLTGNVSLAEQVERRASERRSRFEEGGGFAASGSGVTGLGSAER